MPLNVRILHSLRRSLRAKVSLGVVLPLILILGIFTIIENQRHHAIVLANLSLLASQSGQVIEDNLRQYMLKSDFEEVQQLLDAIVKNDQFQVVYLLNTSGEVIFAPNRQGVGVRLDNRQVDCQPCHHLPANSRPASVVVTNSSGQRVFRSMHPIENGPLCARCHDPDQRLIGLLLTDIPVAPSEALLAGHLRESVLWWIGTIIVTLIIVSLSLNHFVLQRLKRFDDAIDQLGHGKTPPIIPEDQPDAIGQLASAFNNMAHLIEARNDENRALSEGLQRQSDLRGELLKRLITAQEDERKRVARELHDELGQSLGGLALHAGVLQNLIPDNPSRAMKQLEQIRRMITETTDRMYDLILALRPSTLDDLGLAAALRAHAERLFGNSGIVCELDTSQFNSRLPAETETALYRAFQEALNNVVRHSGASQVRLVLRCRDRLFEGSVEDNGRGFNQDELHPGDNSPRGLGLLGMQERIAQCGGTLEIESRSGEGTRVLIRVPLMENDPDG